MHIMSRFTWLHLKRNKKQLLFSGFAILIATIFLSTIGFWVYSFEVSKGQQWVAEKGDWHAQFYTTIPGGELPYIQQHPKVEKVMAKTDFYVQKSQYTKGRPYFAHMDLDANYTRDMRMEGMIISGRMAETPDEITVSEDFFTDNPSYQLGDTIVLERGKRMLDEQVVDVLQSFVEGETFEVDVEGKAYTIVGMLDASAEYSEMPLYLTMGYSDGHQVDKEYVVYVKLNHVRSIYETMPQMAEQLELIADDEGHYPIKYNVRLLESMGIFRDTTTSQFRSTMMLYGVIASAFALLFMIIIYHTFAVSTRMRIRHLGLLKSIGATPKQIRESVLLEGVMIGGMVIPVGILIGYGCTALILYSIHQMTGPMAMEIYIRLHSTPLLVILMALLTMSVVLLSAYLPARKVAKLSPIVAVRQGEHQVKQLKTSWLMKQVEKRCGYEVVMALKSQKANRRSLRTAYLSIGLCFTIITGSVLFANVRQILVELDPRPVQHEMKLTLTEVGQKASKSLGEAVHQIEEVDFVQREKGPLYFRHPVEREALSEEVLARGTEPLEREVRLEDGVYQFEGNIRTLDDASFAAYCEKIGADATSIQGSDTPQAILYNQALYSDQVFQHERENVTIFKWKAGHKLLLTEYMRKSEREETGRLPLDFEVELDYVTQAPLTHGMYFDVYDTVLIMSESTVEQIVTQLSPENQRRYNKEITYLDMDREDIPQVQAQIESIYARHKDKANYDYWDVAVAEDAMAQSMKLTGGMLWIGMFFIAMIGIVNIYSTISSQMVARRREFAMLKSIGISPKGLRKVLILESLGYSLKPIVIGVCFVTVFGTFLLWAIKLGVRYIFQVLPYGMFIGVGGALGTIVFLISYTLMRRIEKENIIAVLRDESY